MNIKVCGMREPDNIQAVAALPIDMMGFIFYPQSPRYVQMISSMAGIIPDYSEERLRGAAAQGKAGAEAVDRLPGTLPLPKEHHHPARVGVFVDEMPQTIVTCVVNYELDYVQLHGQESPTMISNLKRTLVPDIAPGIQIIKVINVATAADLQRCEQYEGLVDLFLFDTKTPLLGGSGQQFDWSVLDNYQGTTPFLLSGGIGPDDAQRVAQFHHPRCIGIDLNSKFETEPGVKDVEKLKAFIERITH